MLLNLNYIYIGFSDHYSPDSTLIHPNLLTHLRGVLVNLGWEKSNIIGHSMGAGASMMYAGCFPETVHKLVLIDGFGANTRPAATTSKQTRLAIEKELQFYIKHTPAILNSNEVSHSFAASPLGSKIYRNVEAAISARLNKLVTYPGTQTMSYEAAASIIKRGMMYADDKDRLMARVDQVASPSSSSSSTSTVSTYRHEEVDTKSDRPVVFSHDPRLYLPSYTSMTVEHVSL